MITLLRRPKLGRTSCREISNKMSNTSMVVRNDRMEHRRERFRYNPETTMVIRWGCTSIVPCRNVLNTARAIQEVNDKLSFRRRMNEANVCPPSYFDTESAIEAINEGKTLVVRPGRHAQGRNLYVVHTQQELNDAIIRCDRLGTGWYAADLIHKVAEYRVFVGSGRVIWVAQKTPGNPEDVAWNVARGGRFDNVRWGDWPLKAIKTAIAAYNLTTLDFGGVDIMVDADGECYVLEINSAPSQTSPYRQECVAKYFDYVIEHGKDRIPLSEERGAWRKFIHPSLSEEAWE